MDKLNSTFLGLQMKKTHEIRRGIPPAASKVSLPQNHSSWDPVQPHTEAVLTLKARQLWWVNGACQAAGPVLSAMISQLILNWNKGSTLPLAMTAPDASQSTRLEGEGQKKSDAKGRRKDRMKGKKEKDRR